eukprot:TRINITY_DN8157_c0_g1_i4.p1 TRINITY_DN8157_c0_g1~~TRINITY_DN8157_c0_g1_i4.p1  ORF type:complete len:237 (+),score=40.74 TRINITY_DN8157_c0_g1_i4:82-711(+)
MPVSQRPSRRRAAARVLCCGRGDGGAMSASMHAADPAAGGAMTGPCPGAAAAAGSPDRIEDLEQLRQEVLAAERAVTVAAVNHGALLKRYEEARKVKCRAGDADAASTAFTEDTDDGPPELLDSPGSTVHSVDPGLGELSPRPPALPGAMRAPGAPEARGGPGFAAGRAAELSASAAQCAIPLQRATAGRATVEAERQAFQMIMDMQYF